MRLAPKKSQELEDSFFPTDAGGNITQLRRKLAGKPSNFGRAAIPWMIMILVFKTVFVIYGLDALRYCVDIWHYEVVTLPYGRMVAALCTMLQVIETWRNVIERSDWRTYLHHIISTGITIACYLYASDRVLAVMCISMGAVGNIVVASYKVTHACKHFQYGVSKLNYYALGSAYWINVFVRGPLLLWMALLNVVSLYHHYYTAPNAFPCSGPLQPYFSVVGIIANLSFLRLDLSWNPKLCRYMEGIGKVLDAEENNKEKCSNISPENSRTSEETCFAMFHGPTDLAIRPWEAKTMFYGPTDLEIGPWKESQRSLMLRKTTTRTTKSYY